MQIKCIKQHAGAGTLRRHVNEDIKRSRKKDRERKRKRKRGGLGKHRKRTKGVRCLCIPGAMPSRASKRFPKRAHQYAHRLQ